MKYIVPRGDNEYITINMSLIIRDVTSMDEINSIFGVRVDFKRKWTDSKIKFANLHPYGVNQIKERDLIWKPYFIFKNVESEEWIKKTDREDTLDIVITNNYTDGNSLKV